MRPDFVTLLRCPQTRAPLHLESSEVHSNGEVITGALRTQDGRSYPIVRGIPRFVPHEHYAASFGYEWNRFPRVQFEAENVGRPMAGHTTRMWEIITGQRDLAGQHVVEFGCGAGRFLDVVRSRGGRPVGLDMSVAVDVARRNLDDDPNVLIVQGDVLHPPFAESIFDGGYTIGVLHHTPEPALGLRMMAAAVRAGGWVACCVYPREGLYAYPSVARWRRLFNRMQRLGYRPAVWYSLAATYAIHPAYRLLNRLPGGRRVTRWLDRELLPVVHLPDARWRFLDIFDAVSPSIASTHVKGEVYAWMQQAGCDEISVTAWCETALNGVRGNGTT